MHLNCADGVAAPGRRASAVRHAVRATADALTGLPDRRTALARLEAVCEAAASGRPGALLRLDLDGFRNVNDSLGHEEADRTLAEIARTLTTVAPGGAVVARIDGDEFAVVLEDVDGPIALATASNLTRALRYRPRMTGVAGPVVTASVGVCLIEPGTAQSVDDVLTAAGIAMQDAKATGRNRVSVYDPASRRREVVRERQHWIDVLRSPDLCVEVYAQAIVASDPDDDVTRIELLVRYRDEDGRIVPPGVFMPVAEETGLIGEVDRQMLRRAVELILDADRPLEVAVNLSAQTFVDPALPTFLDTICGGAGLPEGSLCLEITETAALSDAAAVASITAALRERGCRIALDDFGSGFATFGYLQRLEVDVLKIDGGFIRELDSSETNCLIVRSIVSMARSLGLPVIAEQVETPEALELLLEMGVPLIQGYLFSKPVPVEELLAAPAIRMARDAAETST